MLRNDCVALFSLCMSEATKEPLSKLPITDLIAYYKTRFSFNVRVRTWGGSGKIFTGKAITDGQYK